LIQGLDLEQSLLPTRFFQEGHAERYQNARFGEFRVGPDGKAILIRMRD